MLKLESWPFSSFGTGIFCAQKQAYVLLMFMGLQHAPTLPLLAGGVQPFLIWMLKPNLMTFGDSECVIIKGRVSFVVAVLLNLR